MSDKPTMEKVISTDEAKRAIEEEKKVRSEHCQQAVLAALKADNCDFDITTVIHGGKIETNIMVVPK